MTSGTKNFGSFSTVTTPSGNVFVCNDYGTKTWNGGDRPKTPPPVVAKSYFYSNGTPKRFRLLVTFPGGKKGYVWYRNPWPPRSPRSKLSESLVPHGWAMRKFQTDNNVAVYTKTALATGAVIETKYFGSDQRAWFPNNFGPIASPDEIKAKAIDKLREKVAGSDFDLGVFLGTGHQAFQMIATTATTISKALYQAKRGRFDRAADVLKKLNVTRGRAYPAEMLADATTELRKASRALSRARIAKDPVGVEKSLSSGWLQLQYGWLPLIHDVKSAAESLAERTGEAGNYTMTYRARVRDRSAPVVTQGASPRVMGSGYMERSCQIKAFLTSVNSATLFGITNPLSLAWELLPWSFVADWFIPVGSYLERLNFVSALTGTYVITTRDLLMRTGGDDSWTDAQYRYKLVKSSFSYEDVSFLRSVNINLTVPTPNIIPLSRAASYRRAVNAVALITQRFR